MARIAQYLIFVFISTFLSMATFAAVDNSGVTVKWGYKGEFAPAYWGKLDPRFALCATGKSQSPINITKSVAKATNNLTIHYQPAVMHIIDDGVTDLLIGKTHTLVLDGHGVQLNFSDQGEKEHIILHGKKYRLVQFHFHTPSETHWQGEATPLEIHFVHQSDDGEVAVIGVLVKNGGENTTLKKIIDHLPVEDGKESIIASEKINPAALLPSDTHRYYRFMGSLTTPPCTEGLRWMVMSGMITATPTQIDALRKAAGGENARPVQPLHGRVVSYSKQ